MKRSKPQLQFENLETRKLMAGDLQAFVSEGSLFIQGDDADNGVLISEVSDGEYEVRGLDHGGDMTLINGNKWQTFTGVKDDIEVALGEGNDRLLIDNSEQTDVIYGGEAPVTAPTEVPDDLRIYMNGGDDEVDIRSTNVGDDLYLYTHGGADDVRLSSVVASDRMYVYTSSRFNDGADSVEFYHAHAYGSWQVGTGVGDDSVEFNAMNRAHGNLTVNTGNGDDQVYVTDTSVWYAHLETKGDFDVSTGRGDDYVFIRGLEAVSDADITTGEGQDQVTVNNSSVGFSHDAWNDDMLTGSLNIDAGEDRDFVYLYDTRAANDIDVDLGEGDNVTWIGDLTAGIPRQFGGETQAGNIRVNSGDGRDSVAIVRSRATDSIMAELGAGDDELGVEFNEAQLGHFDLGLGTDMYQLWQNDFEDEQVIDPLYPVIIGYPIGLP